MLNKQKILFLGFSGVLCLGSSLAGAAPTDNLQDSHRQAQERQERLEQPRVQMDGEDTQKPVEEQDSGVRFPIQRITIVNQTEKFQWLERRLRTYEGKEYSLAGINNLLNGLNGAIIKRGFTTTRLALMEQNLSAGELRLVLLEGRIGMVRFADGTKEVYWNGHTLAGAALGLRGKYAGCVSYDMFLASPLVRPEGFKASDVTGGVQVSIAL